MKKKAPKRAKKKDSQPSRMSPVVREGALLIFTALAAYLLVALITYHPDDPSWLDTGDGDVRNAAGKVGSVIADLLLHLLGYIAYLVPFMLGYHGWLLYSQRTISGGAQKSAWSLLAMRWGGFFMTLTAACSLVGVYLLAPGLPIGSGGLVGRAVAEGFVAVFSEVGATVLLLAMLGVGITLWTSFSWMKMVDQTGKLVWELGIAAVSAVRWVQAYFSGRQDRQQREQKRKRSKEKRAAKSPTRIEPKIQIEADARREARERQISLLPASSAKELPPLDLLDEPVWESMGYSEDALSNMSRQIELTMEEFKVELTVLAATPGPVVTRFELEPAPGVKGSKISGYAKDLARALSVVSVRVEEVVAGKSVIGLEVPNDDREMVMASEILRSTAFNQSSSLLTLALGKSINGEPIVCDLAQMPHLLVAGTTGSGKSVAINAMIMSLLYKALPKDLRLILIDPKMLELAIYEGIPHLLTPVVTNMGQAAQALLWCVGQMERRYTIMSRLGVRNLNGYNRKIEEAAKNKETIPDPTYESLGEEDEAPPLEHLPHIVVVIDEFADMMMVARKKVEDYIIRLAQKARAAGIHLILATQRPTSEVITGLIKSNIPARISFRVASQTDSRTVLDKGGAEQLLGHGDMLFLDAGEVLPKRVHGAFISDDEVRQVVKHLRQHGGEPDYVDEVTQKEAAISVPGLTEDGGEEGAEDPLYQTAVEIVRRDRKASISYLQRRLKVGYNRAARMIEEMEAEEIVGAVQPGGTREILLPPLDEA